MNLRESQASNQAPFPNEANLNCSATFLYTCVHVSASEPSVALQSRNSHFKASVSLVTELCENLRNVPSLCEGFKMVLIMKTKKASDPEALQVAREELK